MEELYYGRGKDSENKELIKFLDEVFFSDENDGTNFFDLLPKIYKDQYRPAYNNFVVKDSDGNFRSAIGNFYSPMRVGDEDIHACCIGNVAVGKNYRSMGYMKDLMKISVEDMRKSGVDMAFLGGQRQRYGYFGFEPAGVRYRFNFNQQTVKHAFKGRKSSLSVEKVQDDDIETIRNILSVYKNNLIYSKRDENNCIDVLRSWWSTPYVLKKDGEFVGYYTINGGQDTILEFGCVSPEYYADVILAIFENGTQFNYSFPIAPFETDKVEFFTKNAENMDVSGCESLLIYNFKKVINAYLKAKTTYAQLCDGELTVTIHGVNGDEKLKIAVKNNTPVVEDFEGQTDFELSNGEAIRAFFSIYSYDRNKFAPQIQQWFPLPAFLFGTDTM